MEPKSLPPVKINPTKLLPSSSISAITKKISVKSLSSGDESFSNRNLGIVKKQVIKISDLIKTNTLLKQSEETKKRKLAEQKKFTEKEEKLEAKPEKEEDKKIKLPGVPKLSFLDRIKKFLFNILLGFVVVRLLPQLPKLMGVVKLAGQALDFVTDWGGKLLNGLVTFIDWGYKAYDGTKALLKNLGGDNFTKVFDGFVGAMDKVIEASIIAMIAFGELGGGDAGGGPGGGRGGRGGTRTASGGKPLGRPDIRNPLRQKPKVTIGTGGTGTKGKLKLPKGLKSRGGLLGLLFLIPDLIESGMLVSQGRSKDGLRTFLSAIAGTVAGIGAAAVATAAAGALGITGIGLPGAIALAIAGFSASSLAGTAAFNLADAGFRKMGLVDNDPKTGKPYQYAGGGSVTRGGKLSSFPVRREVKKPKVKREVSIAPPKLKPGADVGGGKEMKKMFPESSKSDTMNPLGYAKNFYDKTGDIPFFGPIFGLAIKTLLGDKPSSLDYENVGKGLNSWMGNTFSSEVLRTGGAFAGGGEVNSEMFMRGEDLTKVISKSVEETVSSRVDNVLNDLMKQLGLKEIDRGKEPGETAPGAEDEPSGSPNLTGNTNAEKVFRYLVDKEGFTPEASAGVIGNLMQESGVNPKSRQLGGGPGRGIMQWTESERWASLTAWANNSGKDPWALETQVEWMIKEMKSYGTYNRIKGVSSYKKAVEIFEKEMERAGTPNYPRRYQFAADALASFSGGAGGPGIQLGRGYGSAGSKIAGELGRFIKQKLRQGPDFQAVTEHPEHGGVRGRHADGSFHYSNRAIDIGAYTHEQGPILRVISEFNRMKGIKPVELLHGGNDSGHRDHVHVAYGRGGLVRGFTRAILGERGIEFVLDTDTTSALEQNFPGFLDALNKANYDGAINVLRNYAYYELGSAAEVIVEQSEPEVVMVPVPTPQQSVISSPTMPSSSSWRDHAYMQG
jgi:hypothetical protein